MTSSVLMYQPTNLNVDNIIELFIHTWRLRTSDLEDKFTSRSLVYPPVLYMEDLERKNHCHSHRRLQAKEREAVRTHRQCRGITTDDCKPRNGKQYVHTGNAEELQQMIASQGTGSGTYTQAMQRNYNR